MTTMKRRHLFHPFMPRRFSQTQPENVEASKETSATYPGIQYHHPFGRLFAPYPKLRPDETTGSNQYTPVDPLFGPDQDVSDSNNFELEKNILPIGDSLNINAIHSLTKDVISTLHTVDKSLDIVVKTLTVLDNYNINLATITGKSASSSGGPNILRLATDFIKKINVNQLEQTISILQSPMVVELLKNGLDFDADDSNSDNSENTN
ncbi:hypothetical protein [Desulfuribacillus alkaliarsenatis]|uniref:Uncharacterized protein n=1 Tax=Desulfuribacillus alkaliarsenatis TaxID=766136 RepID=A0A1E5G609_9FIRM|nr:hypothetical protein [Desulfuribacillus alkaliarsenatis]OEF98204.1 hypothetical protein BHF68_00510 [Desulfuribacillus alkaliarsenatis]